MEIGFDGREQQAFAEPAWTTEEIIATVFAQLVDKCVLVDVGPTFLDDLGKCLYADGIFGHSVLKLEYDRKNKHFLGKDGKKKGKTRIAIELSHEIAD